MTIKTEFVYPPIPFRRFDWMAYDDDTYCGCGECRCLTGHGATEQEAIADLMEQIGDVATTYHTSRGGNSNGLHVAQGSAPESDRHSAISEMDGAQKRNGCVAQVDMPRNDAVTAGEAISSAAIQFLDVADQAIGNAPVTDGLQVGDEGVGGGCEQMRALQTEQGQDLTANGGRNQSARSCENTADSQVSTPLYLLASEIVDIVEFSEQLRLEEEAAAEEGALIEASGYRDPAENVRFA